MANLEIDATVFLALTGIVMATLLIGWVYLFSVMKKNSESIHELLGEPSFLQNLTVITVVCAASLLAVAGIIKGELIATLLSGIVGYVLGNLKVASGRKAPNQPREFHGPVEVNRGKRQP